MIVTPAPDAGADLDQRTDEVRVDDLAPGHLDAVGEMLRHAHTVPGLGDGGAHVGTISDGSFPTTILLGMSYLKHVEMKENNGVLSLIKAW